MSKDETTNKTPVTVEINKELYDKESVENYARQNPQIRLDVLADNVKMYIQLVQQDGRMHHGTRFPYENNCRFLLLNVHELKDKQDRLLQ